MPHNPLRNKDFEKRLGAVFAGIRRAKGLTQTELGDMIFDDYGQERVCSFENGARVNLSYVYAFAAALGIRLSELFSVLEDPELEARVISVPRLPLGTQHPHVQERAKRRRNELRASNANQLRGLHAN